MTIVKICCLTKLVILISVVCNTLPTPRVYGKAHVFALAVRIRSKLLQPFGLSSDLLKDMKAYIKELENLKQGITKENEEDLNAFHRINNQGGPVHLLLRPVDTQKLSIFYNWDENTAKLFEDMFKQTLHQWNDLQVIVELIENKNCTGQSVVCDTSNF